MLIIHSVDYNLSDLLEASVGSDNGHSPTLYINITSREVLDTFERLTLRADQALPSFNESVVITHSP